MEQFTKYLKDAIENAQKIEKELIAAERKDEANLQKIRANVYGISESIFRVLSKTKTGKELTEEFLGRWSYLFTTWTASYEKAKEHNDTEKILVEEIKLEVHQEVKEKFLEWSE